MANVLAVMNGKGGVGKTSLVANVAGIAAASGWRTLVVDLDPQANLARDLGFLDRSDGGAGLLAGVLLGQPLVPLADVRPGLDAIAGGPETRRLGDQLLLDLLRGDPGGVDALRKVLEPVVVAYDLVVLDLPPGDAVLQQAALRAARWVLVPTTGDVAANDGLGTVFASLAKAREANPELDVLGVVVMFVPTGAAAMLREIRADLDTMLAGRVRVFDPPIRAARRAALDCRAKGLLATEYEAAKASALPWYEARRRGLPPERFAANAAGLAEDYQRLAEAVLGTVASTGVEVQR